MKCNLIYDACCAWLYVDDEEGEQMDYLGGEAGLKHDKQMAKLNPMHQASPAQLLSCVGVGSFVHGWPFFLNF